MNLEKITESTKTIVENFSDDLKPEEIVQVIDQNTKDLDKQELLYTLSLVWAKVKENDKVAFNSLTPFSIAQVMGLIISQFVPRVSAIKDQTPAFYDLAIEVAAGLSVPFIYDDKTPYIDLMNKRLENDMSNIGDNPAFVSQAIVQDSNSVLTKFQENSKEGTYLFALVSDELTKNPENFAQLIKNHPNLGLRAMLALPENYLANGISLSILVFYNKKVDNKDNVPNGLLVAQIPPLDNLEKLNGEFKDYLANWVKNNLGENND